MQADSSYLLCKMLLIKEKKKKDDYKTMKTKHYLKNLNKKVMANKFANK